MFGSLSSAILESRQNVKDLKYWEAQVETPRDPVTHFESATLESLAKEWKAKKSKEKRKASSSSNSTDKTGPNFSTKCKHPLQIWGDGDGSYFDRWLAVTPPKKTHQSQGSIRPTQGFKAERMKAKSISQRKEQRGRARAMRKAIGKRAKDTGDPRKKLRLLEAEEKLFKTFEESEFESMFYNSSCSSADEEDSADEDEVGSGEEDPPRREKNGSDEGVQLAEHQMTPRSRKYIGSPARYRLFQRYHRENANLLRLPALDLNQVGAAATDSPESKTGGSSGEALGPTDSARRNYLTEVCKKKLPPMSLQIRKNKTSELNLSFWGIGDDFGSAFAAGLRGMPQLETLDLSDNRLTGKSLSRAMHAAVHVTTLTELNLSSNRLGVQGMKALMVLLKESKSLESLGIADSRCGDKEAEFLAAGLSQNTSLKEVDLHGNNFGVGAGLAFAKMLDQRDSKSQIEDLDLSWTEIRKEGAVAVAKAIAHNTTLEKLDLSYCAFGDTGTMHMMESLRTNTTMNWLEMDNNQIKGRGAMVISNSLEDNQTLTYLQLWDNPLGKSGGRAMLRCVARTGDVRNIDLENCNFEIEEDGLFDPSEPATKYDLDLTDLYERAVGNEFIRIISAKPGCQIKKMSIDEVAVPFVQLEPDQLEGYKSEDEFEQEDESESDSDADDAVEDVPKKRLSAEEIRKSLLFRVNGDRFKVPNEGRLRIECCVQPRKPKKSQVISKDGLKGIMSLIFDSERLTRKDRVTRLKRASEDIYMHSKQLIKILKKIKEQDERREIMDVLIPRLTDPENKLKLLLTVLGERHIDKLEDEMGCLFHFTPQNPTGHYELNLDIENDRKLMRQLIEINNDDKRWAMERSGREDVSRDGDWEHFRNGVYKSKPIKLHAEWEVPREGVLEFDYVHAKTPSRKARGLVQTSSKFNRMCKNLGLHPNCDFKEKPNLNPASILSFFRPKYDLSKLEGKKLDKAACSRIQFWYRKHLKAKRAWEAAQPRELTEEEKKEVSAMRLQGWYRRLVIKWYEAAQQEAIDKAEDRLLIRREALHAGQEVETLEEPYCTVLSVVAEYNGGQYNATTDLYHQVDALMARALFTDGTKIDMTLEEAADELEIIMLPAKENAPDTLQPLREKVVKVLRKLQDAEKEELARQAAIDEANRPKAASGFGGAFGSMMMMAKARQSAEEKARVRQIMSNGVYPLRRAVSKIYLTCAQVAYLLRCFPGGENIGEKGVNEPFCRWIKRFSDPEDAGCTETLPPQCRVTVLQSCFSRIVDLENIWTAILLNRDVLSHEDYLCALSRIGYLNLWNPMGSQTEPGPDLIYDLDMSIKEHYNLTLMLIELADVEPGENFLDETWTKFDKQAKTEYIPGEKGDYVLVAGWELPMSWVENGPPDKGWLHVYYYSGRDDGNKEEWDPKLKRKVRQTDCTGKLVGRWGCAPVWDLRKKLTKNCLCGNKT